MIDLYYESVGRGATLLLNVPPNRDGLLGAEDVASLKGFGDYRRSTFEKDLAAGAKAAHKADAITYDLRHPATFNVIRISEDIRYGQRIDSVMIDRWDGGAWQQFAAATSVGPRRLIRLEKPVTAERLRLRITASAPPLVSEFALFAERG